MMCNWICAACGSTFVFSSLALFAHTAKWRVFTHIKVMFVCKIDGWDKTICPNLIHTVMDYFIA